MPPTAGQSALQRLQASKSRSDQLLHKLRLSRVQDCLKEPATLLLVETHLIQEGILTPIEIKKDSPRPSNG